MPLRQSRATRLSAVALLAFSMSCARTERDTEPARDRASARRPPEPAFTPVTDDVLRRTVAAAENWLVYGGAYNNQRYSALDQITRENVSDLVPVWVYQTGIAESFSTTPIVVDNTMYVTTPESGVVALNAATGERLWEFRPELRSVALCCGPNNRGVAAYGDRVYVATLDARLIALNNRTGEVIWDIEVADPEDGHSITMAPLAYAGKVVVGTSGADYGIRGFVSAYDATNGSLVWRWYTIPEPGEVPNGWWGTWAETDPFGTPVNRNIIREREDSARYPEAWRRGGGSVWMTPAYEPASNTLYLGVGNPAPGFDGVIRPGDNLYTNSIVALDGDTGQLRWYFQMVPHDRWGLDAASPPFLFTLQGRRYLGHAGETGWLYIVDAATGAPILRSDNFVPQDNLFAQPTEEGVRIAPGVNGGSLWSPVAYSPRTGLAYVLGVHQPMLFRRTFQPKEPGRLWLGGSVLRIPGEEQWGILSAIDVATGDIRWQRRVPVPMVGGALVTAGDVLFVGQGTGYFDAIDAETGDVLWQFNAGAGVHGGPVTYAVGGVQYVAVAAGGNHHLDTPRGNAIIAFALRSVRQPGPVNQYEAAQYPRFGPVRYGAARQIPAAELERVRRQQETQNAQQ